MVPEVSMALSLALGVVFPFLVALWSQSFFSHSLWIDGLYFHLTFRNTNVGVSKKSISAEPARILFATRNSIIVITGSWRITGMPRLWCIKDGKTENTIFEVSTIGRRLVLQLLKV